MSFLCDFVRIRYKKNNYNGYENGVEDIVVLLLIKQVYSVKLGLYFLSMNTDSWSQGKKA